MCKEIENTDYLKVNGCIVSCKTPLQLQAALNLINLFITKHGQSLKSENLKKQYTNKKLLFTNHKNKMP